MRDSELQDSLEWLLTEAPLTNTHYVVQMRAYQGAANDTIAELDLLTIEGVDPSDARAGDHTTVRWVDRETGKCGFGFVMYVATSSDNTQTVRQHLSELFSNSYARRTTPLVIGMSREEILRRFSSDEKRNTIRQLVASLSDADK